jgi:hypothetical protein
MKKISIIALMAVTTTLGGCATIFSGTSQSITVKAVDTKDNAELSGVSCSITDPSGNMFNTTTNPSTITISKGGNNMVVNCKKPGYRQLNMGVGDSFNALTVVNVFFWPGFIVDAVSGAYKKYPSHYQVNMERA